MSDRKKVINTFEKIISVCKEDGCDFVDLSFENAEQILVLLKKQTTTNTNKSRIFHCEKCGYGIDDIFLSDEHNYPIEPCFCPNCGRSVKRDD